MTNGDADTTKLENAVKEAESLSKFLNQHEKNLDSDRSFVTCMQELMKARKLSKADIVRLSQVDRVYAYEVMKGKKRPSRDKVLMFAIGMQLPLTDCQILLTSSGYNPLSAKIMRDAVLIFAIMNRQTWMDLNLALDKHQLDLLI